MSAISSPSPLPTSHSRAVVLIPSFIGSLLRYRLLRDTLQSIAASEQGVDLTVLLSFQCCIRDSEQGEEEAEKRDDQLVDDPHADLAYLDSNPLSAVISHKRLQQIFGEEEEKEGKEARKRRICLRCFEHAPVDEGAVLYGAAKPMSQFQHIRFLAQFVDENDIVFFSDDDDISLPTRYSRITSMFNSKDHCCDLKLVFHEIVRFHSTSLYHPVEQLQTYAETEAVKDKEERRFPEYFQFVIRGSTLKAVLNSTLDLQGFHLQDVRFCEALNLLMQDKSTQTKHCNEPLLVFRKAAHKRYWSSSPLC